MDWIFQWNPKRYDLQTALERGTDRSWAMNQRAADARPGQRVFIMRTGTDAALFAVGRIASAVYQRIGEFGNSAVDLVYEYWIIPPRTRADLRQNELLSKFRPLFWAMGTNIAIEDGAIAEAIWNEVKPFLQPISTTPMVDQLIDQQTAFQDMVHAADKRVRADLLEAIRTMDDTGFEYLLALLLSKMQYDEIRVTRRSGDGGCDVKAILRAGGVTEIPTLIEAKRWTRSVPADVVRRLRGAIGPTQNRIVITTSSFSQPALDEAKHESASMPITCIDGPRLVDLLVRYGVGVRTRTVESHVLVPEEFAVDQLRAKAEEAGVTFE